MADERSSSSSSRARIGVGACSRGPGHSTNLSDPPLPAQDVSAFREEVLELQSAIEHLDRRAGASHLAGRASSARGRRPLRAEPSASPPPGSRPGRQHPLMPILSAWGSPDGDGATSLARPAGVASSSSPPPGRARAAEAGPASLTRDELLWLIRATDERLAQSALRSPPNRRAPPHESIATEGPVRPHFPSRACSDGFTLDAVSATATAERAAPNTGSRTKISLPSF